MNHLFHQNLILFRELIRCNYNLSHWVFDHHAHLIDTNCERAHEMVHFFSLDMFQINNLFQASKEGQLIVLTNQLSMVWIADGEQRESDGEALVHLIGPAFVENASLTSIELKLSRMSLSEHLITDFTAALESIPLVPISRLLEYGLMMHYCISGQRLSNSDFIYITAAKAPFFSETPPRDTDMHSIWIAEQKMLKLIEEGNLEYKKYISQLSGIGSVSNIGGGNSLRQMKNLVIVYIALCSRAAIRGGLDPDIAYSLSDRYINSIEDCNAITDIAEINAMMQEDYVRRVYRRRNTPEVSPKIQKCCAYIQLHLGEQISLSKLAKYINYSDSYLSKKFKEEMHMTLKEYVMKCRIEQARELLRNSNLPVQELCDQLGFGSQSYFGEQFRKATGMTPIEYRKSV